MQTVLSALLASPADPTAARHDFVSAIAGSDANKTSRRQENPVYFSE